MRFLAEEKLEGPIVHRLREGDCTLYVQARGRSTVGCLFATRRLPPTSRTPSVPPDPRRIPPAGRRPVLLVTGNCGGQAGWRVGPPPNARLPKLARGGGLQTVPRMAPSPAAPEYRERLTERSLLRSPIAAPRQISEKACLLRHALNTLASSSLSAPPPHTDFLTQTRSGSTSPQCI